MDRDATLDLIDRLLVRVETRSTDLADAPMAEDVGPFLSEDRHRLEVDRFFLGTPQVVGFAGQVRSPGDVLTTEVVGVPIVICRDASGVLRAFVNACTHRGARVADGPGSTSRLTCGFHGWTYSLDGVLAGRRSADAFPPADASCSLRPLPVSDRSGLLVVAARPDVGQEAVDSHLASIEDQLVGFDLAATTFLAERRVDVDANWKLVTGVSCESYHFATLHRTSVAQWLHDHAVFDEFGRHCRWAFPLKGIERLRDEPRSSWPAEVPGAVNHVLFPGTILVTSGSGAQLIRAEPAGPGRSHVTYLGVHHDATTRDAALAAYDFGGDAFEREDLVAVAQAHRGLASGASRLLIGRNEPALQFVHRTWREQLDEATDQAPVTARAPAG